MPKTTEDDIDPAEAGVAPTIVHVDPELAQQRKQAGRDLAMRLVNAAVADAVGLLMRSDRHRHYSLADLEWLLLPPLKLDQVAFAYVRPTLEGAVGDAKPGEAPPVAVAMVTWAAVSPEVSAKLNAQKKAGQPYRLAPNEWRCGKEARIIDTIGDEKLIKDLVEKVRQKLESKGGEAGPGVRH